MSRPRVVYWNNIPAPYMVERFNALAARGAFEFEAWFNAPREPDRSWSVDPAAWRFPYRFLPAPGAGRHRLPLPTPLLGPRPPDLLISLYAGAPFVLGWQAARRRGVRTAFWCEVTFDRWVPRRPWKEGLKRYLFSRVDGVVTPGPNGRAYAQRYGADPARVFLAPHAVDRRHFLGGSAAARRSRDRWRAEAGARGVTFLYVGRLWRGKGLDTLLTAFALLRCRLEGEATLLLVGDGPEEGRLRDRCRREGIRGVAFAGFRPKEDLPRWYAAADAFVFPTLGDPYGLAVDEAMTCGLPVVCTTAAGEVRERLEDGVTGFLVPPGDATALLNPMLRLACDPALRGRLGAAARRRLAGRTPERWAADLERAAWALLSLPRRREAP
ncbi:MAG TPA: glycosyltransferase [Dehalococcoidia bacterium]